MLREPFCDVCAAGISELKQAVASFAAESTLLKCSGAVLKATVPAPVGDASDARYALPLCTAQPADVRCSDISPEHTSRGGVPHRGAKKPPGLRRGGLVVLPFGDSCA